MNNENKILVYTDGASRGNPGPGGYGAIILFSEGKILEIGGREDKTTNNRMEMMAVLKSLELIESRTNNGEIVIFSDSAYVVNGISGWMFAWEKNGWKTKEGNIVLNQDIWKDLFGICFRLKSRGLKLEKVPGHAGVILNERADIIAQAFADNKSITLFVGEKSKHEDILKDLKVTIKKSNDKRPAYSYVSLVAGVLKTYKDWKSCEADVKGKNGAKFRKVFSKEEEQELLKEWAQI
jgi:ribonuclease HI